MNNGKGGEEALVSCGTTKGPIVMRMHRDWSPHGYDRVVELFERGFYDDTHFFRAVPKFLCQFGITYSQDKELRKLMHEKIPDDPQLDPPIPFDLGTLSFAGSGPDSRTSQIFISYGKIKSLGTNPWETPFGEVVEGIENAVSFYSYGDMPPWGKGPVQGKIYGGPEYINDNFPLIDKMEKCTVKRIPARSTTGGAKENESVEEDIDAFPEDVAEPVNKNKFVRGPLVGSDTDASSLVAPENEVVLAAVFLLALVLICLIRGRRKSEAKTQ